MFQSVLQPSVFWVIVFIFLGFQCLIAGNCNFEFESIPEGFIAVTGCTIFGFALFDYFYGFLKCGEQGGDDDEEAPAEEEPAAEAEAEAE